MFDINEELDEILRRYGLLRRVLLRERIESAIRSVVAECTSKYGKRIILRCLKASENGHPLLKILSDYGNVVAVVDREPFAEQIYADDKCYKMVDLKKAEEIECDVYIINSKFQGKNIYYEIKSSEKKCHIVDLYSQIRVKYGIAVTKPFDEYDNEEDFSHNKTQEAYEAFQREKNEEHLTWLLSACLANRDFVTFYEVMEEAYDFIKDLERFRGLKEEIDNLLDEIRVFLKKRESLFPKDIIMHWMDQVGYDDLDNFPELKNLMGQGLLFENAYTVTPYTVATEACIFYQEEVCKLNMKNLKEVILRNGLKQSKLYHDILDNGYVFNIMGGMARKYMPEKQDSYTQIMVASSVCYWNMINYIIHSEKPVFGIIGCLSENHEPWMSPKVKPYNPSFEFYGSYAMSKEKVRKSALYYDKIIKFFTDMFSNKTIHIYMSDHGKWEDIDLRRYGNYAIHTVLGITNMGVQGRVSQIFSYQYFAELIQNVMNCAKQKMQEHLLGDMELRSEGFKATIWNRVKESFQDEKEAQKVYSDICSGYIGIKTNEDTYICLNNGREFYFLNSDKETVNRINEQKYSSRIDILRKRVEQRIEG